MSFVGINILKNNCPFYGLIYYSKLITIKLCAFPTFSVVKKINTSFYEYFFLKTYKSYKGNTLKEN